MRSLFALFVFTFSFSFCAAQITVTEQQNDTTTTKQINIVHGANFTKDEVNFPGAAIFSKDERQVQFEHEGADLWCDIAIHYLKENRLRAIGNVRMKQGDSVTMTSGKINYDGNTKLAKAFENGASVALVEKDIAGFPTIDLTASAPSTDIALQATVAPPAEDYKIDGDLVLNLGDLSRYRTLVGQPFSGAINAKVDGSFSPDLSVFDLALDATTRQLRIGNTAVDKLLAGDRAI